MLKRIFPPANELTLFVMATTLLSLFFYMNGWADTALSVIADHFSNSLNQVDKSTNIFDGFISFFTGVILLPAIILGCVIAPLIIPFVRWDVRSFCIWILLMDCIIISIYNIKIALQAPTAFQIVLSTYCVIWAIYTYICMKYEKFDHLIEHTKPSPVYVITAASISIISVFIAVHFYLIDWVKAYSMSIAVVSTLFSIGVKREIKQQTL